MQLQKQSDFRPTDDKYKETVNTCRQHVFIATFPALKTRETFQGISMMHFLLIIRVVLKCGEMIGLHSTDHWLTLANIMFCLPSSQVYK
jgi:hypothetical protein